VGTVSNPGRASWLAVVLALVVLTACGSSESPQPWQIVARDLPVALFSVWGASERDVFAVGADAGDGRGPLVEHFDGAAWSRLATGQIGNLWWVFGFPGGAVYMGGEGGTILRYQGGSFTKMTTPGIGTVFGIWGGAPSDLWAVGGNAGGSNGAFAWRLQGDTWIEAPGFPAALAMTDAIWKVHGRSTSDVWMVGTNGVALQWNGSSLTRGTTGVGESLFTVHADQDGYVAVGGFATGRILENTGTGWHDNSPAAHRGSSACVFPHTATSWSDRMARCISARRRHGTR